jgi:hypothetical protein
MMADRERAGPPCRCWRGGMAVEQAGRHAEAAAAALRREHRHTGGTHLSHAADARCRSTRSWSSQKSSGATLRAERPGSISFQAPCSMTPPPAGSSCSARLPRSFLLGCSEAPPRLASTARTKTSRRPRSRTPRPALAPSRLIFARGLWCDTASRAARSWRGPASVTVKICQRRNTGVITVPANAQGTTMNALRGGTAVSLREPICRQPVIFTDGRR